MEDKKCPHCGEKLVITEEVGVFGESYGDVLYCDLCDRIFSFQQIDGEIAE